MKKPFLGEKVYQKKELTFLLAQVFFSKKKKCVYAYAFRGKRYDAGDKLGYVKLIIDSALENEDLKEEIGRYLQERREK